MAATVQVRMLWDLGGHHKDDEVDVSADEAPLYVAAGYVELVTADPTE